MLIAIAPALHQPYLLLVCSPAWQAGSKCTFHVDQTACSDRYGVIEAIIDELDVQILLRSAGLDCT